MPSITCFICEAEIVAYEEGDAAPAFVVVPEGAAIPAGDHVVHVCPLQAPYTQKRPQDTLDWTDEQERAAVKETLPNWDLRPDDQIFCLRWFRPGWGRPEVKTGPFTVQVRRNGVDLKYAEQGVDFDEATFTAAEAMAIAGRLGIEPWPGLLDDLAEEESAGDRAAEDLKVRINSAKATVEMWSAQMRVGVKAVDAATAALRDAPDDGHARLVLQSAKSDLDQATAKFATAEATVKALVAEQQSLANGA